MCLSVKFNRNLKSISEPVELPKIYSLILVIIIIIIIIIITNFYRIIELSGAPSTRFGLTHSPGIIINI